MNKHYLRNFILLLTVLFICFLCSGCAQSSLMGGNLLIFPSENTSKAFRLKNGTVIVKADNNDNITGLNSVNPGSSAGEVAFGPKSINFDH